MLNTNTKNIDQKNNTPLNNSRPEEGAYRNSKTLPRKEGAPSKGRLLATLEEDGVLTNQEYKALCWYRRMFFKCKKDVGAPRCSISSLRSLSGKFGATSPCSLEDMAEQEAQDLKSFRALRRRLTREHNHLVRFAEALFEYPGNDLAFYNSWSPSDQQEKVEALKAFSSLIKA